MIDIQCPRCGEHGPAINVIGASAFCTCGWYGAADQKRAKRAALIRKVAGRVALAGSILMSGFLLFEYQRWDVHLGSFVVVNLKDMAGLAKPVDWQEMGLVCKKLEHFDCMEKWFGKILKRDATNDYARSQIGHAQVKLGKNESAIANFEKLVVRAETNHRIMADFAEAKAAMGDLEEAKLWYYRALRLRPQALYVADDLIDLLVKNQAYTEALGVIGNIQSQVDGADRYFAGRVAALGDLIEREIGPPEKTETIRLASYNSVHYIPVRFDGMKEPAMFLVDSGASVLTLSSKFVREHGLDNFLFSRNANLQMADGSLRKARLVTFKSISIGPWKLENVDAAICDTCSLLAGKSVLRKFQTTSRLEKGIEYLNLTR